MAGDGDCDGEGQVAGSFHFRISSPLLLFRPFLPPPLLKAKRIGVSGKYSLYGISHNSNIFPMRAIDGAGEYLEVDHLLTASLPISRSVVIL